MRFVVKILKSTKYKNRIVCADSPQHALSKLRPFKHALVIAYFNGRIFKEYKEPFSSTTSK